MAKPKAGRPIIHRPEQLKLHEFRVFETSRSSLKAAVAARRVNGTFPKGVKLKMIELGRDRVLVARVK